MYLNINDRKILITYEELWRIIYFHFRHKNKNVANLYIDFTVSNSQESVQTIKMTTMRRPVKRGGAGFIQTIY